MNHEVDLDSLNVPEPPAHWRGESQYAWKGGWEEGARYGLRQRNLAEMRTEEAEARMLDYSRVFLAVVDLAERWRHSGHRNDGSVTRTGKDHADELMEVVRGALKQAKVTVNLPERPEPHRETLTAIADAARVAAARIGALATPSGDSVRLLAGAFEAFAEEVTGRVDS